MSMLSVPCAGGHQHVRIDGKYTKPGAVYHPQVAERIASCFAPALKKQRVGNEEVQRPKLESVVINDLLLADGWETLAHWFWSKPGHINVLESRAFVALEKRLLDQGGNRRFNVFLDSRVAKGAHAKGRSSALSLRPSLLRSCSYQIAGNLYPAYGFAPTRLNTADAPSRDKEAAPSARFSILEVLSSQEVVTVHSHQFSRAAANWIRLYILACICFCPGAAACAADSTRILPRGIGLSSRP